MESVKKELKVFTICITGAAGNVSRSLFEDLCNGSIFGENVAINLRLLDIESKKKLVNGIKLELIDGAYPLLQSVEAVYLYEEAFRDIDIGIFCGG